MRFKSKKTFFFAEEKKKVEPQELYLNKGRKPINLLNMENPLLLKRKKKGEEKKTWSITFLKVQYKCLRI